MLAKIKSHGGKVGGLLMSIATCKSVRTMFSTFAADKTPCLPKPACASSMQVCLRQPECVSLREPMRLDPV